MRPFLSKADRKTRKETTGNFGGLCQISPALRSKDIGKKYRRRVGRIPAPPAGETSGSPHRGSRCFFRARFYHSTKFRLTAHFVLRESCWGCHPKPAFLRLAPLEKIPEKNFSDFSKNTSVLPPVFLLLVKGQSIKRKELKPMKKYNTPHRRRVIKTRLTEEEYTEFSERVTLCQMSQAEFIRQALIKISC